MSVRGKSWHERKLSKEIKIMSKILFARGIHVLNIVTKGGFGCSQLATCTFTNVG